MQTQHSVIKRGPLYWDREALPAAVFHERLRQVQTAMAEAGDDAWIMYGDAQRYGAAAYVSHFLPRARSALVLVPRSGEPVLLASVGPRDIPAVKTLTTIEDVRPFTRLPREAVRLLMERQLGMSRIGLVGAHEALSHEEWQAISSELPQITWRRRDADFDRLRASKTAPERALIARAGEIVETGLRAAEQALLPGAPIRQALAAIDKAMRYQGAEDVKLLLAAGSGALRPASDDAIPAGQPLSLLAAVELQRYWSEGARTFGGDDRLAAQAVDAMVNAARPGATAGSLAEAGRAVLSSATGWTSTSADDYGLGHGIGLDLEEPPFIRPGEGAALHAGATLALHVVLPGSIAGRTITI